MQRTYTLFLINLIAVLGLGVFSGNSGILSFGHVAFIGIGAYVSGDPDPAARHQGHRPAHLPELLATVEWGLPAALAGDGGRSRHWSAPLSALPIVRMGGAAAVIATLGLLLIVHGIIIGASDFTRGSNAFLGVATNDRHLDGARDRRSGDHSAGALVRDSRFGGQLRASREDETGGARRSASTWCAAAPRLDAQRRDLRRVRRAARAFPRRLLAVQVLLRRHARTAHHADRRRHDDGVRRVLRRGRGYPDGRDPAPYRRAASTSSAGRRPRCSGSPRPAFAS